MLSQYAQTLILKRSLKPKTNFTAKRNYTKSELEEFVKKDEDGYILKLGSKETFIYSRTVCQLIVVVSKY
jgi:hypothetical protein